MIEVTNPQTMQARGNKLMDHTFNNLLIVQTQTRCMSSAPKALPQNDCWVSDCFYNFVSHMLRVEPDQQSAP